MKLVVQGASKPSEVPGLTKATAGIDVVCAVDAEQLAEHIAGAEALLGWDFRGKDLASCWQLAADLKWIHWCGAGVDALLFPELIDSDVTLTNSRGVFDRAMAEYVLGYMLYETKRFPQTLAAQAQRQWNWQMADNLAGQRAMVFGVGSIGREIARTLNALGVQVSGVGRSARAGDDCFDTIHAAADATEVVGDADWLIGVMPATPQTDHLLNSAIFSAMKPTARLINIGRGRSLDEAALLAALSNKTIAGAMLDVFETEPLPAESPLWTAPNLVVSPHMSGDYHRHHDDLARMFLDNLERYRNGRPLNNIVDKALGFVTDPA